MSASTTSKLQSHSASVAAASATNETKESATSSVSVALKRSTDTKSSRCSIKKRNVEDNVVVWLDASVDDANDEDQQSLRELNKVVATIQMFANSTTCIKFFEVIEKEKVFLICSGSLGEEFIPKVHDQAVINSVYVFCSNKEKHKKWADKYPKVKGVYTEFEFLCKQLKTDVQQTESSLTGMSILDSLSGDLEGVDPNSIDAKYMHSEMLKWYLVHMPHDDKKELEEFVHYCTVQYANSETDLKVIDEFRRTYNSEDKNHTPIWWYTRECFIYKMLNKALRVLDIEVILKMGFFFSSLHHQIYERHKAAAVPSNFQVYRGQGMETSDFLKLKKSINGFLTFTSFLSTSTKKDISIPFAKRAMSNPNTVGVLFIIDINSKIQRTYFASISDISFFNLEDETLFSSNTVFRIRAVEAQEDGVQHVHLQLTGEDDEKMVTLIEARMREVRGIHILDRLGNLLYKMDALKEADKIFQCALREVSKEKDTARFIFILENLAIIHADGQDSDVALFFYNLALEHSLSFQSNGDSFTSELYGDIGSDLQICRLYGDIGSVLHDQGDLKGAEEHYERSLQILSKDPKKYEVAMSSNYFNMGTLYQDQKRFDEALKMFQQSLDIRQRNLHPYHPLIASTYLRMVDPSLRQRQFVKAEEYSRKGIELYLKSHPAIDSRFAKYYYERALSFQGLNSYGEALKYAEKALEIAKRYSMPTENYEAAVQGLKRHV